LEPARTCRALPIDRTTLNKIEKGSRGDVAISQLFEFAKVLGIAPVHLLTRGSMRWRGPNRGQQTDETARRSPLDTRRSEAKRDRRHRMAA
jgi:transcriptional regulator with XRE-family HTH domain